MLTSRPLARSLAAIAALGLVVGACGSDDSSDDSAGDSAGDTESTTVESVSGASESATASQDADSVTIYSGRNEDLIQPILDQFSDVTGVDVNVKYGDSADLALRAGCSERTAELIRHQSEPIDPDAGVALQLADEAS